MIGNLLLQNKCLYYLFFKIENRINNFLNKLASECYPCEEHQYEIKIIEDKCE